MILQLALYNFHFSVLYSRNPRREFREYKMLDGGCNFWEKGSS